MLGTDDETVTAGEEQHSDERRGAHLPGAHPKLGRPSPDRDQCAQHERGRDEAYRRAQVRRERLHGDPDAEVRRAPDDVHDRERGPDRQRSGSRHRAGAPIGRLRQPEGQFGAWRVFGR